MKRLHITDKQKYIIEQLINNGSNILLLNEENRTQKKKCVEYITNNCPSFIRQYLDYKLNDLPDSIK